MSRRHVVYCASVFHICEAPINYKVQHALDEILPSKYNILHININSLQQKIDDLELYIHKLHERGVNIHIISVAQIKIHREVTKFYNLSDYNSYFSVNSSDEAGCALFVHKSLTSGIVGSVESESANCLIANITALNINVGVFYKNPTATTESVVKYYHSILKDNQRTILFSDVNIDLLHSNASTRLYTDVVNNKSFSILNKLDSSSSPSTISSHVLTNIKKFKYYLSLLDVPLSSQKLTFLGFDNNKPDKIEFIAEPNVITYDVVDYRTFNWHFSKINLQRVYSIDYLVSRMNSCRLKSIRTKEKHLVRNKRWINSKSLKNSDRLKMRREENAQEINEVSGDSKLLYDKVTQILTNKTSNKHSIDAMQNINGQIVTDKGVIANMFNVYFLNIGRKMHSKIPSMTNCLVPGVDFNRNFIDTFTTNSKEVLYKIRMMKKNNSILDSIPSNILKYHSRKLSPLIADLFNNIFHTGQFPESLKTDRISPVFKSQDPLLPKNYRPISVPPNLSKVMESIICDQITDFCLENNIINQNQYGFQKNSSALSAVVAVIDYLQVGLNTIPNSIGACLFIDLKKASNTIPHDRLMGKLFKIGIRDSSYDLIKDYLHGRRQFVNIDNVQSVIIVNSNAYSIPQGSALGPLFFLLYINDIFKLQLHGKIILYADDTAIAYVETDEITLKRHMQSDLKKLNQWFNKNALTLNTTKTKLMVFNAENIDLDLHLKIRDKAIETVDTHKYLGIELQNNLKWNIHIDKIIREVSTIADRFIKIGNQIGNNVSYAMYNKYVYNRLSKMASIYGSFATKSQIKRLQTAQDLAVQRLFPAENCNNVNDIYTKYKLLQVQQIINYDLALLIYKLENDLLKLNCSIDDKNGQNILSIGKKYFDSLHPSIRKQRRVEQFKKNFRKSCFRH